MRLMIPVFNSLNVTWLEGIDDRDGMRDNISQLLPFVTWLNISPILPAVITWLRRAWQERSSGHQTWCRQGSADVLSGWTFCQEDVLSGLPQTFCQEDVLSGPFYATYFSGGPASMFCQEDVLSGPPQGTWLQVVTCGYGWLWGSYGWLYGITSVFWWLQVVIGRRQVVKGGKGQLQEFIGFCGVVMGCYEWQWVGTSVYQWILGPLRPTSCPPGTK